MRNFQAGLKQLLVLFVVLCEVLLGRAVGQMGSFGQNYGIDWGNNHVFVFNGGNEAQLSLDYYSGGRFRSKRFFGSGKFDMRIKVPGKNSAGVVTAFYLSSEDNSHDELDFEFLGNVEGKPIILQTNVFASGDGNKEQRLHLWFDPTADFHTYSILWNQYQIVFYVDRIPIRVVKNNEKIGVKYPSKPLQITASLWNGDDWATDGGQTKINWSYAPFHAYFQGFEIKNACPVRSSGELLGSCHSSQYWWNTQKYWKLSSREQQQYDKVKKKYIFYDYCNDPKGHPVPPPECSPH